jgi:anti-sigma B factor antagonist
MIARSTYSHLDVHESAETVHVVLIDCRQLDEQRLEAVRDELLAFAEELGPAQVCLSLAQVEYMPSAGLGLLLTFKKKLDQIGAQLVIGGIRPLVRELFEITRLADYFNIVQTAGV